MKGISEYISEEKQAVEELLPGCVIDRYELGKSAMTFVIRSYDGHDLPKGDIRVLATLTDGTRGGKLRILIRRGMYGNVAQTVMDGPTDLADALADAFQHSYPATGINRGVEVMPKELAAKKAAEVLAA